MAKYAAKMQRTASTTASLGSINAAASAMRRVKIYDILLGSEAAPADNAFLHTIQRCTTAGTSTAITPQPLDPADAAAGTVAGQAHSAEPTYTANQILLDVAVNQKATFRWVAIPGGELVIPATASNGIGFQTPVASAVLLTGQVHFEEQ